MHIADPSIGILGANGIVGAGLPIAVGAALAAQRQATGAVAVAFAGEGAVASGSFHESMWLAALWSVPVLFLIENNRYAEFTNSESMWRGAPLVERALGYGRGFARQVDGNDVQAVRSSAREAVAACRAGLGPCLIEALTFRHHGHFEGDPTRYFGDGELDAWKARDPIHRAHQTLVDAGYRDDADRLLAAADEEMDSAVEHGLAAPYPDTSLVLADVFA